MRLVGMGVVCVTTGGCFASMPPPLAEGTDVLPPNAVGLTVAAGGGGISQICRNCTGGVDGGAGEGRLRVGIGGQGEIGVSGFGGFVESAAGEGSAMVFGGGELSYKIAPAPW